MTKDKGTMLVLGGHGVFGSMIAAAARPRAGPRSGPAASRRPASVTSTWPSRTRLEKVIDEADVIVSTVPDRQVVAERHRTTVVRLPEPYGRRRCLGIAEQHGGWLGPIASGKTVSTYLCVAEHGLHGVLLAVNATGLIGRRRGIRGQLRPGP
jgi:hypothetical protein